MPTSTQHLYYNDILGTPAAEAVRLAEAAGKRTGRLSSASALLTLAAAVAALVVLLLRRADREAER